MRGISLRLSGVPKYDVCHTTTLQISQTAGVVLALPVGAERLIDVEAVSLRWITALGNSRRASPKC